MQTVPEMIASTRATTLISRRGNIFDPPIRLALPHSRFLQQSVARIDLDAYGLLAQLNRFLQLLPNGIEYDLAFTTRHRDHYRQWINESSALLHLRQIQSQLLARKPFPR